MKQSEMLRAGIARIEQYGWVQGMFGAPNHGYCIRGSFREEWLNTIPDSFRGEEWVTIPPMAPDAKQVSDQARSMYFLTYRTLDEYIEKKTQGAFRKIVPWNDAKDRTKEQVLDFMDEVATYLEAQGL